MPAWFAVSWTRRAFGLTDHAVEFDQLWGRHEATRGRAWAITTAPAAVIPLAVYRLCLTDWPAAWNRLHSGQARADRSRLRGSEPGGRVEVGWFAPIGLLPRPPSGRHHVDCLCVLGGDRRWGRWLSFVIVDAKGRSGGESVPDPSQETVVQVGRR
jgi:hypothetical protein